MDEKRLLSWFEQVGKRVPELMFPNRTNGLDSAWTDVFTEMETALESVFPPSHPVLRKWKDAMARESQGIQGNWKPDLEKAQDDLIAIFRVAHRLLVDGHARSFADGVRAETIMQCVDQADALARAAHAVAAMVLAGGALETHLRNLCERFCLSWQGEGSISKYNQALGQARSRGTQDLVTSSDSSAVVSWGQDRNGAAHSPLTFTKTSQEVLLIIESIRQFILRTQ